MEFIRWDQGILVTEETEIESNCDGLEVADLFPDDAIKVEAFFLNR